MKRLLPVLVVVGLLVVLAVWSTWSRPDTAAATRWTPVVVEQGPVVATIREVGELAPRDPLPVTMPLAGRLEWLVEEGVWVDAGDELFIVNEEEALTKVTELRGELVAAEQELALARMRREQAAIEQDQRIAAAERKLELEAINHRIIATQPKGGDELVRLHERLQPLEREAKGLRDAYETALAGFRSAEDRYLQAYDAWQDAKDAILRQQARADELSVQGAGEEPGPAAQAELDAIAARVDELQASLPTLAAARDRLAEQREVARQAMAEARAALDDAEAGMEELFIAIEIEKRGLEMARLQIDVQLAELDLEEAQAELAGAEQALALGAVSESRVEELRSTVKEQENALAIVRERLAIAARPAPPEELTEAETKRQRAEVQAAKVRQRAERALKKLDLDIEIKAARLAKIEHEIGGMARDFPAVLASTLDYLRQQLEALEPDAAEERQRLEAEIAETEAALAAAETDPPNVVKAPVAGVVRIAEKDDRAVQVGDELELREVVLELKPLGNMEVVAAVNEVHVQELRVGMPATLRVPALPGRSWRGAVREVAGAGRDKFSEFGRFGTEAFAGVTVFDVRIAVDEVDEAFRQGMTVLATIEVDRLENALHLPRAAIVPGSLGEADEDGIRAFTVITDPAAVPVPVRGRLFGADRVLVTEALAAGDIVYVPERQAAEGAQ